MAEPRSTKPQQPLHGRGAISGAQRREREARALRENLARRKTQSRARTAEESPESAEVATPEAGDDSCR